MKKGLYALSFGTFGLGIAEFIMMSILPDVAAGFDISLSEAGHLISAYALGVCVGAPLVVVVACFGWAFCCRESAYGSVCRLLDGVVCPVCIGVAAWGLFRSRFDCCQPFGGEREKHFCCSYYDNGDDDCQFVRCPGREFPGALSVLAFGFCDCSVVGWRNDLVYPEVGSCFARPAGDESERAVSFFEKAGTMDADCCYHVRKRGSFLLV